MNFASLGIAMPELASSFEDAWAQFQRRDALRLAGDTQEWEWSRGRAQYLTFLVRMDDPAVRTHLAAVIERIAGIAGIEPYPEPSWHATVKEVGFQVIKRTRDDEILRGDVARLAGKARAILTGQPPYRASLGLANGFAGVVFVEVIDGGETDRLHGLLRDELSELPSAAVDASAFLPHVSLARFTSSEGLDELKSALGTLRQEPPGPGFTISRVELIKAWLSEEMPEFETLATYTLAGAALPGKGAATQPSSP